MSYLNLCTRGPYSGLVELQNDLKKVMYFQFFKIGLPKITNVKRHFKCMGATLTYHSPTDNKFYELNILLLIFVLVTLLYSSF